MVRHQVGAEKGLGAIVTILGKHTLAETEEFLLQKNSDVLRLANAFVEYEPKWKAKDAAQAADFRRDLENLIARWKHTRSQALMVIEDTPKERRNLVASEDVYQDIIRTLQREPGRNQKGDFGELAERLGKQGVNWDAPVNQPIVRDWDLGGIKAADSFLGAAKTGTSLLAIGIVGAIGIHFYLLAKRR